MVSEPGLYYQGFGGVEEVAGSKHILLLKKPNGGFEKILHDCGSNMEDNDHLSVAERKELPFRVDNIDAIVFSHAHFDHIGDIPKLIANGYIGSCFASEVTMEIIKHQLNGMISFDNYKYFQQLKGKSRAEGAKVPKPLITNNDVKEMMMVFENMKYGHRVGLSESIDATFYGAGHIIGSSQVLYSFNDRGKVIKLLTAIDLGRSQTDVPLINPPHTQFPDDIDYALIESTYGGNTHESREQSRVELEEIVLKSVEKKERILIGAFAIMRTHQILSDLFWIYNKNQDKLGDFRIYLDSPSAQNINSVISRHPECFDEQARKDFTDRRNNPFNFPILDKVSNKAKKYSEQLDNLESGPYAIVSASGMWFMGRIVRHLQSHIERDDAKLIITGWQKPGSIGWQLEQGHDTIKIEGVEYKRNAEVVRMHSYGGHADGKECVDHVINHIRPRKGVYIAHGEETQLKWTYNQLKSRLGNDFPVEIVRKGRNYSLEPYNL